MCYRDFFTDERIHLQELCVSETSNTNKKWKYKELKRLLNLCQSVNESEKEEITEKRYERALVEDLLKLTNELL